MLPHDDCHKVSVVATAVQAWSLDAPVRTRLEWAHASSGLFRLPGALCCLLTKVAPLLLALSLPLRSCGMRASWYLRSSRCWHSRTATAPAAAGGSTGGQVATVAAGQGGASVMGRARAGCGQVATAPTVVEVVLATGATKAAALEAGAGRAPRAGARTAAARGFAAASEDRS